MTPEELFEKINELVYWDEVGKEENYSENECKRFIQQAKSEWCKEQRENCLRAFQEFDLKTQDVWDVILNAPEP
jgi:hypothetical protein